MNETKQHFQLPNKMGLSTLKPKDQLVYLCMRSFMNKDTMECFSTVQTIAERCHASVPTVTASIKRLVDKDYILIRKEGRKNIYKFNNIDKFEPFSLEFLENSNISFEAKAFLTATQQYMFTDIEGVGKLSISNRELAQSINSSEKSIRRYNQELERKGLMTIVTNVNRDLESGCNTQTKLYRLRDLGQAIIWKLQEHDDRISNNESEIDAIKVENKELKNELKEQKKLIDLLFKKLEKPKTEFKM